MTVVSSKLPGFTQEEKPNEANVSMDIINGNEDTNKPVIKVYLDNIPQEMRGQKRWLCWEWGERERDGKWTKIPVCAWRLLEIAASGEEPRGYRGSSTEPASWSSFDVACKCAEFSQIAGIGFALGDGWGGIDLDHCVQGDSISFAADTIIGAINTYSEISPSGTGVKMFFRGTAPNHNTPPKEIYGSKKFFTMTGRHIPTTPKTVEERQAAVDTFVAVNFPEKPPTSPRSNATGSGSSPTLEDSMILANAFGAKNGRVTKGIYDADPDILIELGKLKDDGSPDWSAVVYSLVSRLAFWTQIPEQLDRLIRSSALYALRADKWERLCEKTIARILGEIEDVYRGPDILPDIDDATEPAPDKAESIGNNVTNKDEFTERIEEAAKTAEAKAEKRRRRGYTFAELDKLPDPTWAIEGHIAQGDFAVMFGASASFKSFVALEWALCTAFGEKVFGKFDVVPGPVCYIISEGAGLFKYRVRAWLKDHGKPPGLVPNFCAIPASFNLQSEEEAKEIIAIATATLGVIPAYCYVDTLTRNFGDGDPDKTKDMAKYVANIDYIRSVIPTVINVHHSGWGNTDRERNSKNLRDSSDSSIMVERADMESEQVRIKFVKQKGAKEHPPYWLQGREIALSNAALGGKSLVFDYLGDDATVKVETEKRDFKTTFGEIALHMGRTPEEGASANSIATDAGRERSWIFRVLKRAEEAGYVSSKESKGPQPALYWLTDEGHRVSLV